MSTLPVRLRSVTVRRGGRTVLHRADAVFEPRSVTVVAGANGSGKSTLLETVAGVLPAVEGTVSGVSPRSVAHVAQSVSTPGPPLTVRATVAMGRWAALPWWRPLRARDRAVVDEQLARLDLDDLADHPLAELSGGQRQRALVATGLAQRAPVLLVDEPTAGVDARSLGLVLDALATEARRGAVVVHAAHDPEALAAADRVLTLRGGTLS
ncbi:metal ABC transporter ATP-binding protein [Curtobacterium sp. MCBD17_021]|uniref:metal ABC transporter ATP-binding protein n=1 Tax=Curtobacterium sp. MCBD17_021 TaxID=2175665 RepID=UPI0021ABF0F8|nr:ABC transporter ATP-binding protein [Curtobacterium sp. MCBD17_021]